MLMLTQADARKIPLADKSVHMVMTSPPYWGLRDYGLSGKIWGGEPGCKHVWETKTRPGMSGGPSEKQESSKGSWHDKHKYASCQLCGAWWGCLGLEPTPELYVEHLVNVFREVWRVLRDDGTVWLNLGDSYASGGRGSSRHHRQKMGEKTSNAQALGRKRPPVGLKEKDLVGIPWRIAFALQADGWYLRSDIIWHKPNPMPESVTDRPTKSHEYLFLLSKSRRYFYDADAIREPQQMASRLRAMRGWDGDTKRDYPDGPQSHIDRYFNKSYEEVMALPGRNKRSIWTIATQGFKGAHFATYPPALVEPCIKAGTSERGVCPECGSPWRRVTEKEFVLQEDVSAAKATRGHDGTKRQPNDGWDGFPRGTTRSTTIDWQPTCTCGAGEPVKAIILDPFVGSGTTLQVARQLDRHGIGLDLSYTYLHDQARHRLELDALDEWTSGKPAALHDLDSLPLFALTEGPPQ